MNITIQYGTGVITVPADVLPLMDRATKSDLRLLVLLSSDPTLLRGDSFGECIARIAARLGCTPAQAETSLAFWRGTGVLLISGNDTATFVEAASGHDKTAHSLTPSSASPAQASQEPAPPTSRVTVKKPLPDTTLPRYTTDELANLLESRKDAKRFIDECAQIWGKMFNTHEVNILLGMVDYLGLEWDYVITLLAFCAESLDKQERKRTLHYVEKIAYELYDEGVVDLTALQEKLRCLEQSRETEGQLRRLLGIGDRSLTPTEKKLFSKWVHDFSFGMEIITMAFEITVEAKGQFKIKYMDAILTNWNKDSLRTPEAIRAANEQYRAEHPYSDGSNVSKGASGSNQGSFDTDDFFAAAVRRSLGKDFDTIDDDGSDGSDN